MMSVFTAEGELPPGIHYATWEEIFDCFGKTEYRRTLLNGMLSAFRALQHAGCTLIFLDGSFVTLEANPNDYDGCWEIEGVCLELLDPILLDFTNESKAQKKKFGGELYPMLPASDDQPALFQVFQCSREGRPKGIVAMRLDTLP